MPARYVWLADAFEGLDLDAKLPEAIAWCEEQGAHNPAILCEADAEDELLRAMRLKELQARALANRLMVLNYSGKSVPEARRVAPTSAPGMGTGVHYWADDAPMSQRSLHEF